MKHRATERLQPPYSSTIEDGATRDEFLQDISAMELDDTEEGFRIWREYVEACELRKLFSFYLTLDDEVKVINQQLKKQGNNNLIIAYLTHFGNKLAFVGTNGEEGEIEAIENESRTITGIRLLIFHTSPSLGVNSNLLELNQLEEAFREGIQSIDKNDCVISALVGASSVALRETILRDGDLDNHLLDLANSSDAIVAKAILDFVDAIITP